MRKMALLFVLLLLVLLVPIVVFWDSTQPVVTWSTGKKLGKGGSIALSVSDTGKGLRHVGILVRQGGREEMVHESSFDRGMLPWEKAAGTYQVDLGVNDLVEKGVLEEGAFEVVAIVEDQPNLFLFARRLEEEHSCEIDLTPPRVEVLSGQHYLRQGGSEAVLYRVSEEGGSSGVQVGERRFQGLPVPSAGTGVYLALFALPHDESPDTPLLAWAEDEAGNQATSSFWCKTFPVKFRRRDIDLSESFITKVVSEIISNSPQVSEKETPLDTFLEINGRLRVINNDQIREKTLPLSPKLLWTEPFLQLSNSQVEAAFADNRSYYFKGSKVDEQTHLGFDLASLANSPVEASNSGKVVHAGYLGIYGYTVILDHGLGLFSLYAHLSSVDVIEGDSVTRGQTLGRTGQTGLAGGDHLHFSMVLQGVQVNPIEWWDAKWVREHVLDKLKAPSDQSGH